MSKVERIQLVQSECLEVNKDIRRHRLLSNRVISLLAFPTTTKESSCLSENSCSSCDQIEPVPRTQRSEKTSEFDSRCSG